MNLDAQVLSYRQDVVEQLSRLVAIPSVKEPPLPGKPFGEPVAKALDFMQNLAQSLGFQTHNCDGYAVHADLAAGPQVMGILAHLDVVPAGSGWTVPPFEATIKGDRLYARGATDNKGSAVAALYALKAVKDLGIDLTDTVRVIYGGDEESGMSCLQYYASKLPMPDYGFSPDASFPAIYAEKGILDVDVIAAFEGAAPILSLVGGTRSNVVPDTAVCVLRTDGDHTLDALTSSLESFAARTGYPMALEALPNGQARITSTGMSAHASTPEKGRNAIGQMVLFLHENGIGSGAQKKALAFLAERIGMESDGERMGVRMSDEPSGALTLNLGVIEMDEARLHAQIDIRHPVTADHEQILATMRAAASSYGVETRCARHSAPLYMPLEHPVLKGLMGVYHKLTGTDDAPVSMGGGTYARCMKNAVAFGSTFPDRDCGGNYHQSDEYVNIDALMDAARVFAHAIVELAGKGVRLPESAL